MALLFFIPHSTLSISDSRSRWGFQKKALRVGMRLLEGADTGTTFFWVTPRGELISEYLVSLNLKELSSSLTGRLSPFLPREWANGKKLGTEMMEGARQPHCYYSASSPKNRDQVCLLPFAFGHSRCPRSCIRTPISRQRKITKHLMGPGRD